MVENASRFDIDAFPGFPTLSLLGQLSPSGLSSMSQFVVKAFFLCFHTQSTLQSDNLWDENQSNTVGGENLLPCLPPLVTVSSGILLL